MLIPPRLKLIPIDPKDEITHDMFPELVVPDVGNEMRSLLYWISVQPEALNIDPAGWHRELKSGGQDLKSLHRGKATIMGFRDLLTETFGGGYDTLAVYWSRAFLPGFTDIVLEHDLIARLRNHGVMIVRSLDDYFEELHWRLAEDIRNQVSRGPRCRILLDVSVRLNPMQMAYEEDRDHLGKRTRRGMTFVSLLKDVLERECHEVTTDPHDPPDVWVTGAYPRIEIKWARQPHGLEDEKETEGE